MAVSGSSDFSITADQIITSALRKVGIIREDVPKVYKKHQDVALHELNLLVKYLRTKGLLLWKRHTIRLDLETERRSYLFKASHTDAQKEEVVSAIYTAGTTGDAFVIVAGTTGDYSSGQSIEIELDDGTMHSTTVSSTPVTSGSGYVNVPITAVLTDDVAVGNEVTSYSTETRIPTFIERAYRRTYDSTATASYTDTEIEIVSKDYYEDQYKKVQTSKDPQILFYDRKLSSGNVFIWPAPEDTYTSLILTCNFHVDDFDSTSDSADFQQEWLLPLVYNLAAILADNLVEIDPIKRSSLKNSAEEMLMNVIVEDDEQGSLFIQPETSWRY